MSSWNIYGMPVLISRRSTSCWSRGKAWWQGLSPEARDLVLLAVFSPVILTVLWLAR